MLNNLLLYDYYVIVEKAAFISDEQLFYSFCTFGNHVYNTIGPSMLFITLWVSLAHNCRKTSGSLLTDIFVQVEKALHGRMHEWRPITKASPSPL